MGKHKKNKPDKHYKDGKKHQYDKVYRDLHTGPHKSRGIGLIVAGSGCVVLGAALIPFFFFSFPLIVVGGGLLTAGSVDVHIKNKILRRRQRDGYLHNNPAVISDVEILEYRQPQQQPMNTGYQYIEYQYPPTSQEALMHQGQDSSHYEPMYAVPVENNVQYYVPPQEAPIPSVQQTYIASQQYQPQPYPQPVPKVY